MRFALSYPIVRLDPPPDLLSSAAIAEITAAAGTAPTASGSPGRAGS